MKATPFKIIRNQYRYRSQDQLFLFSYCLSCPRFYSRVLVPTIFFSLIHHCSLQHLYHLSITVPSSCNLLRVLTLHFYYISAIEPPPIILVALSRQRQHHFADPPYVHLLPLVNRWLEFWECVFNAYPPSRSRAQKKTLVLECLIMV